MEKKFNELLSSFKKGKKKSAKKIEYDNRWDLMYNDFIRSGYSHDIAYSLVSKKRVEKLFSDDNRG